MDYKTRIADESLEKRLKNKGAVVVEGVQNGAGKLLRANGTQSVLYI